MYDAIIIDFKGKSFRRIYEYNNHAKTPVENSSENILYVKVCRPVYVLGPSGDKHRLPNSRCHLRGEE